MNNTALLAVLDWTKNDGSQLAHGLRFGEEGQVNYTTKVQK
jgi:hypothetical protein